VNEKEVVLAGIAANGFAEKIAQEKNFLWKFLAL
jgi:hypothetical protein